LAAELQNYTAVIASSETADRQANDDLPVGKITVVRDFVHARAGLGDPRSHTFGATGRAP
jgi:hypothetical protein